MQLEQTLSKISIRYTPKITEFDKTKVKLPHQTLGCSGFVVAFFVGAIVAFLFAAFVLGEGLGVEYSDGLAIFVLIFGGIAGCGILWFIENSEMKQKKSELAKKNELIKKGNERNTLSANKKNKIISSSVSKLKSALANTQTELDNLYSSNVIYPKYRNLIAVASMYEYIDSGRCSELEGADGAYNIYELEVRLDRIITQLDIIISNLEQIKANQYYLYTAINNLKPQIDNVVNEIKENTKKSDAVAVNTAITAYTAQVIERNQYYGRNWNDGRGIYSDRMNIPKIR